MSNQTEQIAWKLVSGLLLLLQVITLAVCGYIITQLDNNRIDLAELKGRVIALETINEQNGVKPVASVKP